MPTPQANETEKDFVSRCIPIVMREHDGMKNDQAAAICYQLFKKSKIKNENILKNIARILK